MSNSDPAKQKEATTDGGTDGIDTSERSPGEFSDDVKLGQYRIYAETIENAADRRAAANRFYLTIHISIIAALAIVGGYGLIEFGSAVPVKPSNVLLQIQPVVVFIASAIGIALSIVWYNAIRSNSILQAAKFDVIHAMEEWLPFRAFKDEGKGLDHRNYKSSTTIESWLPWLSLLMYLGLLFTYLAVTNHWLSQLPFNIGI